MAWRFDITVESYRVTLGGQCTSMPNQARAGMLLENPSAAKRVAISFWDNITYPMPQAAGPILIEGLTQYQVIARYADYPQILDLLRNEGPIYMSVRSDSFTLGTHSEPVGEGE